MTLSVKGLRVGYDELQILQDVHLVVGSGEHIVLLGANGAGKTTLLKTLVGVLPTWQGEIEFTGERIETMRTDARMRRGISYISELGIVPNLSIEDNLRLGGYYLTKQETRERMEAMYAKFPVLKARPKALGGSLSGGQRKMLAVAKALMSRPKLVIMDEPSAGLSPLLVSEVIDLLRSFQEEELALLIAEQNVKFLELADRVYVLDNGTIRFSGTVAEMNDNTAVHQAYFGLH